LTGRKSLSFRIATLGLRLASDWRQAAVSAVVRSAVISAPYFSGWTRAGALSVEGKEIAAETIPRSDDG
jgi:hypothetical protein